MSTNRPRAPESLIRAALNNPDKVRRLMELEALRRGLPFDGKEDLIASVKMRVLAKSVAREAIARARRP